MKDVNVFVPSAFSPNGDNHNDLFNVIDKYVDQLIFIRVYNRWGELLFETDDINGGWDGTFKNVDQEMDSYIYHIKVVLTTGPEVELSGNVLLLR